jgi:arylsulfatase A-like enzyme
VPSVRYRSLRDAAIADVGRAIAMATGGALAFAPIEYALATWTYAGSTEWTTKLRLVALVATLAMWLWLVLALVTAIVAVGARLARAAIDPEAAWGPGWFAATPLDARGVRPGVPKLWAHVATAVVFAMLVQRSAAWAILHYKEPKLTGLLIVGIAIAAIAVCVPVSRALAIAAELGAAALAPTFGVANPLGRWRAAGFALAAFALGTFAAAWFVWLPDIRFVVSDRLVISGVVVALGMGFGAMYVRRRRPARRLRALAVFVAAFALQVTTLLYWGADLETKYVAITASPALDKLIALVRLANDVDGDGYGSLLGENDCDPFDGTVHPGSFELGPDGRAKNCIEHVPFVAQAPTGPTLPVPKQFKKPWNILLITIDTLRYDHTTFGGYARGPKQRDTTPRLAELVRRSTSFTFTNAPSAGTMASIPAIITSKYFHSGIALDETVPPGNPPKLKPENVLLSEIMHDAGYHTGVIASHEYWNDWGMDQGVDEYDNSIGKTPDPWRVAADKSTDHALAWITRNQATKWFLWVHYIDPHGRYVPHPGVADYGSSEPDLYDGEIKWTDQEVGRLLDQLAGLPSYDHTIIIITSDHGDSMGEHTVPVGTHGTALYYELQHVPMIFFVPDNAPHEIRGATTNLDIVPTVAELCGIDTRELTFEGKSQVPAIFYGREDRDRIVFAETNAPTPQRAAISEKWKLIYYLQSNLYELYDLSNDPGEKVNLAPKSPPELAMMKSALDGWLERVVYSRDANFNQQGGRMKDFVLAAPASPAVRVADQTLDDNNLAIVGIDLAAGQHAVVGSKVDVHVYFDVKDRTKIAYRFLLAAWPVDLATWKPTDPAPPNMLRTGLRATGDGFFSSDRWRPGEHVRERFPIVIPSEWNGTGIAIGLVAAEPGGDKASATGAAASNDPSLLVLGALPLTGRSGPAPP